MKRLLLICSLLVVQAFSVLGDRPPNIVFFLVDDLGWSDVGCYGSTFHETPHIDRLAREGVKFTNAYAACHVCSPTRASILTGKYPARLNLTDWLSGRRDFDFQNFKMPTHRQALPAAETTLAEALQGHGYRAAIYGKWHLGEDPDDPRAHGFDVQVPKTWRKGWPRRGYYSPFRMEGVDDGKPGDYLTDKLTDVALEFIEDSKGTPFFLYLSHFAVHDPIHGRQDLIEKYRRKLAKMDRPDSPAFVLEGNPDAPEKLSRAQLAELIKRPSHRSYRVLPKQTVKIKQHQDNIRFAAMVEAMDESLGRVLAKLKELQLDQNTIIIFFSDNGGMAAANFGNPRRVVAPDKLDFAYATSNLPLRGAKGWLYEGGVRVPMIVKWPGRAKAGSTCAEPVMSTDFYPSLLEMAGLTARPAQHVDGRSFVPGLTGKPYERGAIYWHFPHYSNHGMQSPGGGIRLGDYKLLEYYERGTVQLFNLKTDPGEQNDLAQKEPAIAAKLRANLHQWRRDVKARMIARKKSQ